MEERVKEVAMAKPFKRADGAKMQPPMTPMIDCTFKAFDEAVAARFDKIHFAVPSE